MARFYFPCCGTKTNIMKKIISVLAIAATFAASCNSAADTEKEAQQRQLDSIKTEMARQHIIDSMNEVAAHHKATTKSTTTHTVVYNDNGEPIRQSVNESQATSSGQQTTQAKKGWSAKAKGAVIGAGVGAITGAAVSKTKKGKGAVIGGVIGAGVGTGVGAVIDKKEGR